MSNELNTLVAEVAETNTVIDSAILLIQRIKQLLDEAIANNDLVKLAELSALLDAKQTELAAAITANTPTTP